MSDACPEHMNRASIRVSCAVIIRHDGLVFAARRGPKGVNALTWEFPGGKVEAGETDQQCLHRELAEELGIQITITHRLPQVRHAYPDFDITLIPFICIISGGDISPREHQEIAWFTHEELTMLSWSAADKQVLACVISLLRNGE